MHTHSRLPFRRPTDGHGGSGDTLRGLTSCVGTQSLAQTPRRELRASPRRPRCPALGSCTPASTAHGCYSYAPPRSSLTPPPLQRAVQRSRMLYRRSAIAVASRSSTCICCSSSGSLESHTRRQQAWSTRVQEARGIQVALERRACACRPPVLRWQEPCPTSHHHSHPRLGTDNGRLRHLEC